ncbi:P-loop containing nucleoside triphosphate hydrolase protein [Tricladium varicosporioides]|nr:P-loop containing nucleoside triphosphate hydrolase protein [Hymenoscyphus varicosporioides]
MFNVMSAMVGRLHANFPRVLKYHNRNDSANGFRFTSKEITDNDWHQMLFHREKSPYNGGIAIDILSQSPKLNWLKHTFVPKVLGSRWFDNRQSNKEEGYLAKAVILSNIPATARLLYEWFQLERIPCCYIAAHMSHESRRQTIDLFQDEENEGSARFLISTASLIGTGTNIPRASYMVLFEPCWTAGDELQAYGRINRVSSTRTTQSYRLHIPGHEVEDRIRLRQQARGIVSKDTLEGPAKERSYRSF